MCTSTFQPWLPVLVSVTVTYMVPCRVAPGRSSVAAMRGPVLTVREPEFTVVVGCVWLVRIGAMLCPPSGSAVVGVGIIVVVVVW